MDVLRTALQTADGTAGALPRPSRPLLPYLAAQQRRVRVPHTHVCPHHIQKRWANRQHDPGLDSGQEI